MLGEAFGRWRKDKSLTERNAPDIAERICYRNVLELYRLDSLWIDTCGGREPRLSGRRLKRLSPGVARISFVPVADTLLAVLPTEVHFTTSAPMGEID
jgi:hypothetical protein